MSRSNTPRQIVSLRPVPTFAPARNSGCAGLLIALMVIVIVAAITIAANALPAHGSTATLTYLPLVHFEAQMPDIGDAPQVTVTP